MRILFMGTPEFAIPSFKTIMESSHELVGVVTSPDKPVGRGLKIQPTPIKKVALDFNIPILQPIHLKDSEFINQIKSLNAHLFVVVAFRILPLEVFKIPPKGTINLHASLLPKYRGAAPINWAIINGEKETGVTTIYIQEKVDAGDIILQKKAAIGDDETAGELHEKLATIGAELLLETINLISENRAPRSYQTGEVTKAPKLTKELGHIQWEEPASKIRNLIRGLSPWPGAYTYLNGKLIKIFRTKISAKSEVAKVPGEIIAIKSKEGYIEVTTGSGHIEIFELQLEGKRKMLTNEFLRGHVLEVGEIFG
ncbi:MAG: methionyl-tRNA formyltransferase [bacterium]